jgi:hypothetical protein
MVYNDTAGWSTAEDGTRINFSIVSGPASAYFVNGTDNCTTTAGLCPVYINSNTAGTVQIHANSTVAVDGVCIDIETDGEGNNSVDANKTYVDAYITLDPLNATNAVNEPHRINATVEVHNGTAWNNAPDAPSWKAQPILLVMIPAIPPAIRVHVML